MILLAGLPEDYRPMIMALENSGVNITGDYIKTKLFQEQPLSNNHYRNQALATNKRNPGKKQAETSTHPSASQRSKMPEVPEVRTHSSGLQGFKRKER